MIKVKELSYKIQSKNILEQINIEAESGEFIGIIGPNGSGKSTLLKNIYKVLKPWAGEVFLGGMDLLTMSNREMAQKLGVVIQEHESSFDFTVEEVIMMGRYARKGLLEAENKKDRVLVDSVIEKTGLQGLREQSFMTLSGGEKQRTFIARALAQATPCLILDEPTNHLDIKYQLEVMDLASSLGKTVIAAIHDLNIAALYCDRIYVLKEGKIIAGGSPQEVLTADFIRDVYEVEAEAISDSRGQRHIIYLTQRGSS